MKCCSNSFKVYSEPLGITVLAGLLAYPPFQRLPIPLTGKWPGCRKGLQGLQQRKLPRSCTWFPINHLNRPVQANQYSAKVIKNN